MRVFTKASIKQPPFELTRAESINTSSGSTLRVHDLTHVLGRRKRERLPAGGDVPLMHRALCCGSEPDSRMFIVPTSRQLRRR
jgi:hypothetical protein